MPKEKKVTVIKKDEAPRERLEGGGEVQYLLNLARTGIDLTLCTGRLEPGAGHHWHTHKEDEIVYVLEGEGTMSFQDREDIRYKTGTAMAIPRGTLHQNINTGNREVHVVAVFSPSLP